MTTKTNKRYPKRNGREMSTKEKRLFDRFEERFKTALDMQGVAYPEAMPFNLAALAVWEMQDYNKQRHDELKC